MISVKRNFFGRFFAVFLAALIAANVCPVSGFSCYAQSEGYSFTVTDGTDPIAEATITITNPNSDFELAQTTDEIGLCSFEEDILTDGAADSETLNYTVSKEGYESASGSITKKNDSWVGTKTVQLCIILSEIEGITVNGCSIDYDGEEHDAVEVLGTEPGDFVTYSEDNINFSATVPKVKDVCKKTIYIKVERSGCNTLSSEATAEVKPIDRTDFKFNESFPQNLVYSDTLTYQNTASSTQEAQSITYSSSDKNVATVDSTGKVSFNKAGTVTITATMAASTNYNEATAQYTITVDRAVRTGFFFIVSNPAVITYGDNNNVFENTAVNTENDGNIKYSIKSQQRNGIAVNDVATIDKNTGKLTINKSGIVTVCAKVAGGYNYKDSECEYTLTINKDEQSGFAFSSGSISALVYGTSVDNAATGGESSGNIEYSVESGSEYLCVDSYGKITAVGVGKATVKATHKGDDRYNDAYSYCDVSTTQAEQSNFKFPQDTLAVLYGTQNLTISAMGGNTSASPVYSVVNGSEIASINENTGEVTFKNQKRGTVDIKAVEDGDSNYKSAECTMSITVDYDYETQTPTISGSKGKNGWYNGEVDILPPTGYYIAKSDDMFGSWNDKIAVTDQGANNIGTVYLKSRSDGSISKGFEIDTIMLDSIAPQNLKVEYSEPFYKKHFWDVWNLFYKESVTVTISADDVTSSIDHFIYKCQNQYVTINKSDIAFSNNTATASFDLSAPLNDQISIEAYDVAGNNKSKSGDRNIIVDNTAPVVSVSYDNNNAVNTNYYNSDRTATISVKEDNFDPNDVDVEVGKKLSGDTEYTKTRVTDTFEKAGDCYVLKVKFEENADYTFDVSCSDNSGNVAETYPEDRFTIDKTKPAVSVAYSCKNADGSIYYNKARSATVSIDEHNFDASLIDATITAKDAEGNTVEIDDYDAFLKNPDNWTKDGDNYKTEIVFNKDADYKVNVTCKDLAGNSCLEGIDDNFNIDTQSPKSLAIDYTLTAGAVMQVGFGWVVNLPIQVNLKAEDETGGVKSFIYRYDVAAGADDCDVGGSGEITAQNITYSNGRKTAKAHFIINSTFKGQVSFYVVDQSGNKSGVFTDSNKVAYDVTPPKTEITVDKTGVNSGGYYNTDLNAIIEIQEENFSGDNVVIELGKRNSSSEEYSYVHQTSDFTSEGGNKYKQVIALSDEGEYSIKVEAKDIAGNSEETVTKNFIIDKTAPTITVRYDSATPSNGKCFNKERTAEITVNEHYFTPNNLNVSITATDNDKNAVDVSNIAAALKDSANWTVNGDNNTAKIVFSEEGNYTVDFSYTDFSQNSCAGVNYDNSYAPTNFVIDKTSPVGSISVGDYTKSANGEKWDHLLNSFGFDYCTNKSQIVTIKDEDTLSGIYSVEYYKSSSILNDVETEAKWTKASQTGSSYSFAVSSDDKFIVYVRITDKAGNVTYLSSNGVIIDKSSPNITNANPEVTITPNKQPVNGIYNTDVKFDVTVTDPKINGSVFSGLKKVSYQVLNIGSETQHGTLFEASEVPNSISVYNKNACFTVDKAKNNSNDVIVKVTAEDCCGNVSTAIKKIKIDITAPKLSISYSNNKDDSTFKGTFNNPRTATIKVTERNFDAGFVSVYYKNNENGKVLKAGNWTLEKVSGNGDNNVYTAKIAVTQDGKYSLSATVSDKAGNKSNGIDYMNSESPADFTIDRTAPKISLSYNNNNSKNGNYYNAQRTATLTITEHNFETGRVSVKSTATRDNKAVAAPTLSGWKTVGDTHTATINYNDDGLYSFEISYSDKAGNKAQSPSKQTFYVDKTMPTLNITGVANNSANNGDVKPVVVFSDSNFDPNNIKITLNGAVRKGVALDGAYSNSDKGKTFTFNNFEKSADVDDIYTLSASITDKAGNTVSKSIIFSVNRFGSTYAVDTKTAEVNNKFVKDPEDIVLSEVNDTKLNDITVTLFKNDKTINLVKDQDYRIDVEGGNGDWYKYTYTIFKKNFSDDGVYRLSVHSTDSAGNIAENTLDTKNKIIKFGIDNTSPTTAFTTLASGITYSVDKLTESMIINDNLKLSSVVVMLDGKKYKEWTADEISKIIDGSKYFTFDISGNSTNAHNLEIISTDAAGNKTISKVNNFYVTTNVMVRYYNNKALFFGSLAALAVIIAAAVILIIKKSKQPRGAN